MELTVLSIVWLFFGFSDVLYIIINFHLKTTFICAPWGMYSFLVNSRIFFITFLISSVTHFFFYPEVCCLMSMDFFISFCFCWYLTLFQCGLIALKILFYYSCICWGLLCVLTCDNIFAFLNIEIQFFPAPFIEDTVFFPPMYICDIIIKIRWL